MAYHSIHLRFPAAPPFDQENWFETFVGHFVKPLLDTGLVNQFWFTRYGSQTTREVRVRITTVDFRPLEEKISVIVAQFGLTDLKDENSLTLVQDLGWERFLSQNAADKSPENRAQLVLNLLHSVAVLFVESLTGPDDQNRYDQETNLNGNNPHGSVFESIHHLLCNTTNVVTEVEVFRVGDNMMILESPLYAHHIKAHFTAQKAAIADMGKFRVRF